MTYCVGGYSLKTLLSQLESCFSGGYSWSWGPCGNASTGYDLTKGMFGGLIAQIGTEGWISSSSVKQKLDAAGSGYNAGTKALTLAVSVGDMCKIDEAKLTIKNADIGDKYTSLTIRNIAEVCVKIGDVLTTECLPAKSYNAPKFQLTVINAEDGVIDASQAKVGVDIDISLYAAGRCIDSEFSLKGSIFGDDVTITKGGITSCGKTYTYDGRDTEIFAHLGAGDDKYDDTATNAKDYIWGGSGNDTIKGGCGDDVLFGDFGFIKNTYCGKTYYTGYDKDPISEFSVKLGGSNKAEDWLVDEALFKILGTTTDSAGNELSYVATELNQANWANLSVPSGNNIVGIGVRSDTSSRNNNDSNQNPQITPRQEESLDITFARTVGEVKITLQSLFKDDSAAADGIDYTEIGSVKVIQSGGISFHVVFAGDGRLAIRTNVPFDGTDADFFPADGSGVLATGVGTLSTTLFGKMITVSLSGYGDAFYDTPGGNNGEVLLKITVDGGINELIFKSWGTDPDGRVFRDGVDIGPLHDKAVGDFVVNGICYENIPKEGKDVIDGGCGDDLINGGGDNGSFSLTAGVLRANGFGIGDRLTGGEGRDTFVYDANDGFDVVYDYKKSEGDKIIFDRDSAATSSVTSVVFEGVASTLIADSTYTLGTGMVLKGVVPADVSIMWV